MRRRSERAKREILRRMHEELAKDDSIASTSSCEFYSTIEVRSWGSGRSGQLGLGDQKHCTTPHLMHQLYRVSHDLSKLRIWCSEHFTAAITEVGHVYLWGKLPVDTTQHLKAPERIQGVEAISLACSTGHVVILSTIGKVYSWGKGGSGRLGHGDLTNVHTPKLVEGIPSLKNIIQVACGEEHTMILDEDGTIFSFGGNRAGQLGIDSYCESNTPIMVTCSIKFRQIACGMNHSGAISVDNIVYTWGWGENGRLGLGHDNSMPSPTAIDGLKNVSGISFGGAHSLAHTESKKVYAWGWGVFGQLGNGHTSDSSWPKLIKGLNDVEQIACGFGHSAAITGSGCLYLWGFGEEGQLGTGYEGNHTTPQLVWANTERRSSGKPVDPPKILHVALGKVHSIAVAMLSMNSEMRERLTPESIRQAATTIQKHVRKYFAVLEVSVNVSSSCVIDELKLQRRRIQWCNAQRYQYEQECIIEKQYQQQLDEEEEEYVRKAEEEKCRILRAMAVAKREAKRLEIENAMATRIQTFIKHHYQRRMLLRAIKVSAEESIRIRSKQAAERKLYLSTLVREYQKQQLENQTNAIVEDVFNAALVAMDEEAMAKAIVEYEEMEKINLQRHIDKENQIKAQCMEQERVEKEARRQALVATNKEHMLRRGKEIAEAKAKAKLRLLKQNNEVIAIKKEPRKRKLKASQLRKVAEALNASREDREKLRQELVEQKRQIDEQNREKEIQAAKAQSEKHRRLFKKSLTSSPVIKSSLGTHIRAAHIAETYKVLPGEIKPHYVLDPNVQDELRAQSKHRIFRELQPRRSFVTESNQD
ncbi:regulator of chromosome condensation rcc1 [Thraustotheca clavata]|uniref:Regulator of chromosome condensation rcc1 n=1 Tax=Thraustotheca clavata TaxID=74557 RepID=A0A1V9ZHC1_9STRA|nr:regulator of chromosome condensation rcc1 [Thraustotheca clavata]